MKMTKTEFKNFMKECLKDLIKEGFLTEHLTKLRGAQPTSNTIVMIPQDELNSGEAITKMVNPAAHLRAQAMARSMGRGNPEQAKLFESVLLDSLETEVKKETGFVSQAEVSSDQAELNMGFGSGVAKWASLALNQHPQRK